MMTQLHLTTTAVATTARIIRIATFWLLLGWSTERRATNAYSILPPATTRRKGTHSYSHPNRHPQSNREDIQPPPTFHRLTRTRERELSNTAGVGSLSVTSSNHDCLGTNSTSMGTVWTEAWNEDLDEERDRQLLRSMLEAMADLESVRGSSDASSSDCTSTSSRPMSNQPYDTINDSDDMGSSSSSSSSDEVPLFFPRMAANAAVVNSKTGAVIRQGPSGSSPVRVGKDHPSALPGDAFVGIEARVDADIDADATQASNDAVWRARWLLVGAAALYGTNFSVVKLLGDQMPVSISTSFRFGLAALATLPWLLEGLLPLPNQNTGDSAERNRQRFLATLYGLEVGLWNSIGYVAQAIGLETTLASESAFLCSMAVVIVPLLDFVAGKKLLPRQWTGALMALVGVAFLELGGADLDLISSGGGGGITVGDQLSMIQPFAFGLGFWRMEQAMHRFPKEAPRMTASQLVAIFASSVGYGMWDLGVFDQGGFAGVESSLSAIAHSFPWKEWFTSPSILFSLFWTGCITTALTIYMETLALESLSAAETTLIFSTEPLWGTAFAVAVMGEHMGLNAAVGATLIVVACLFSNLGIDGLFGLWASATKSVFTGDRHAQGRSSSSSTTTVSRFVKDNWPWLSAGLAGVLATWNVALGASQTTQEVEEIVDGLIENLADKL